MTRTVPWSKLTPDNFADHADGVTSHLADEFATAAKGEVFWLTSSFAVPDRLARAAAARALRIAAMQIERSTARE